MNYIIAISIIFLIIFVIEPLVNKKRYFNDKLDKLLDENEYRESEPKEDLNVSELNFKKIILNNKLERVGLPFSSREYNIFKIISFIVIFLFLYIIVKNIIISMIFSILWLFVPNTILNILLSKKQIKLEEQLPSVLMKIKNSVETGIAVENVISELSKGINEPLASEFRRITSEMRTKIRFETALTNMKNRLQNEEINLFVAAILTQRKTGGDSSTILGVIIEEVTARLRIKKELRTLTAQGRVAGFIVGGLPFILGLALHFISPEHMKLLFTTTLGQGMLVVGILLQIIGIVLIFKILKIDF